MKNKIELLAPVGTMESLHAAIENGTDAVYLGGKLFNARASASNFDKDELKEAVTIAHLKGVKVYVTCNILVDQSEVEEVLDYIKYLYEIDVDAIIIQDLGLLNLVRKLFPDLAVHASTQMTINNEYGVKFLEGEGVSRVVLARETPLNEIKKISESSKVELESFIHGALCVSYSGQCLMSSLIGGRSGNRGTCAQPCRMAYSIVDDSGKLVKGWDKKYVLSPKDLNTIDDIPKLIESGISSLKIEGRMKKPEYVATIVKNYRTSIDQGIEFITEGDKKDIAQMFNRGFTKGLGLGDFGKNFISYDRPGNQGILLGTVERADKYKVYLSLKEDVNEGDIIEFELADGELKGIKMPFDAKAQSKVSIEKPGYILPDTLVYKKSDLSLIEKAKASYNEEKTKYPIDMEIDIHIGKSPRLIIMYKSHVMISTVDDLVQKGENISLTEEKVILQLSKLGDTNYLINNININLDEGSYLPMSILNILRRNAIEELDAKIGKFNDRALIDETLYNKSRKEMLRFNKEKKVKVKKLSIKVDSLTQFHQLDLSKLDRIYLGFYEGLELIVKNLKEKGKEVYIWTDKILYSEDLERLYRVIKPIEQIIDGISVSNLGSLKFFKDKFNLKIHGDMGLNVFNSYTAEYLNSLGLDSVTLSPELNLTQIKAITDNTNIQVESIVYGYLASMITKTCPMALVKGCTDDKNCTSCNFNKGYGLKDRMDATFYMERKQGFTTIYNSVPLMVLDNLDSVFKSGVETTRLDFTRETKNITKLQIAFYDYIYGLIDEESMKDFVAKFRFDNKITNGHYFRGVM